MNKSGSTLKIQPIPFDLAHCIPYGMSEWRPDEDMGHSGEASFGEDLRKAREQRGLRIDTISDSTKVPAKHIRALEAGHFGEIPGGVFRRGFVRSYVAALGLEEVRWMKRFDEVCRESGLTGGSDADWTQFAENVKNNRAASPPGRAAKGTGFALLIIGLVLAAWFGWRLLRHRKLLHAPMTVLYSRSLVVTEIRGSRVLQVAHKLDF